MKPFRLVPFAVAACGVVAFAETPPPKGNAQFDDAQNNVFLDDELTQIYVTVDPGDLDAMLADPYSDTMYPCTVHIVNSQIDEVYANVGMRPRGNTSRSSIKKSWKLDFNEYVSGQNVHGLEKFNINGQHNDPSIIRAKLSSDLFVRFGVPAPRSSNVYFKVNDGALVEGLYTNVEQVDEEFADVWFGNNNGNLYKCRYQGARADLRYVPPGDPATYANLGGGEVYEEHINDPGTDYTDLADFIAFIDATLNDDAAFVAGINDYINVDSFLRAMAVDICTGNWDDYWFGANNFYLYHNEDTGAFEYIPFDFDNTYGVDFFGIDWSQRPGATFGDNGFGWDPDAPPLIRHILQIPEFRDQIDRYVRELVGSQSSPEPSVTTYTDSADDLFFSPDDPHFDISSVDVSNDETNLYLTIHTTGPIDVGGTTDQARFIFLFDTRPGGSTTNAWGRQINATVEHDYHIGSWTDGGGGVHYYDYDGGWNYLGTAGLSQDLSDAPSGIVRYTVALANLGLSPGDSFDFDCVSTDDPGGGFIPGLDHLSNPNVATPNFTTASTPGPYLTYTVQDLSPPAPIDGPFTLGTVEPTIDTLKALGLPVAFQGSFADEMDWGYTAADYDASYTSPTSYENNGSGWDYGLKPYITNRTDYLRNTVGDPGRLPRVYVNEMVAVNGSIIQDEAGDYDDWVELYNDEDVAVDLGGMYLSDNGSEPKAWQIPAGTTIGPKGFLLIWCDDEPLEGALHATFKLSSGGEGVWLSHTDAEANVLIDALTYPPLVTDTSYGRFPDGSETEMVFETVTPEAANDDTPGGEPGPTPAVFINEYMADNDNVIQDEAGDFDDWVELYNAEPAPVDIGGMFMSDNLLDKTQWEIPAGTVIPAGGHLLVWCDDEAGEGTYHANFKLGASGEAVGLFDRAENLHADVDSVTFGTQTTDVSEGRNCDGDPQIRAQLLATPGGPNPSRADLTTLGAGSGDPGYGVPDGSLTAADIQYYVNLFVAADPASDFTTTGAGIGDPGYGVPDGSITAADVQYYVNLYVAGCP